MSKHFIKHIVRRDHHLGSRTNWAVVDALTDEMIDYSDIPPLPESYSGPMMIVQPPASKMPRRRHGR